MRWRFVGEIAGCGSTGGVRVVVGRWAESPLGAFADVMLEQSDRRRVLLAPAGPPATFISRHYHFDEVCEADVEIDVTPDRWQVRAGALRLELTLGARPPLGRLLRVVPARLAGAPWFATVANPVAAQLLPGVRTRGKSRAGARQWYGAHDLRDVIGLRGRWRNADLGVLSPVHPPVRFGFASTPPRPSVTAVTTTLRVPAVATEPRRHLR